MASIDQVKPIEIPVVKFAIEYDLKFGRLKHAQQFRHLIPFFPR